MGGLPADGNAACDGAASSEAQPGTSEQHELADKIATYQDVEQLVSEDTVEIPRDEYEKLKQALRENQELRKQLDDLTKQNDELKSASMPKADNTSLGKRKNGNGVMREASCEPMRLRLRSSRAHRSRA